MANNTNGRPMNQRPSTYKKLPFTINGGKPAKKAPKGVNRGVDGIDRSRIDDLEEERRAAEATKDPWD